MRLETNWALMEWLIPFTNKEKTANFWNILKFSQGKQQVLKMCAKLVNVGS